MLKRYFLKQFLVLSIVFTALLCIGPTNVYAAPYTGGLGEVNVVPNYNVYYHSTMFGDTTSKNWVAEFTFQADELGENYFDAFCVEAQELNLPNPIRGYNLTDPIQYYDVAAKIADYYFHYNGSDYTQKDFQVAIWHVLNVVISPSDAAMYSEAKDIFYGTILGTGVSWSTYEFQGWIAVAENNSSQNYMIGGGPGPGGPTPTPEPATMVLFGVGLIGIAGVSRRKATP